jgi:hypothetical protein
VNSDEEKKYNRKHSKVRVIVEHTVSRIKKFGIMGTKFRNKLGRYDHAVYSLSMWWHSPPLVIVSDKGRLIT